MNLILVVKQNIMTVQTQEPLADEVSRYLATLTQENILEEFAELFSGDDKLEGDLHLNTPVQLLTKQVLFPIKQKLQEELNGLATPNIVRPVTAPNACISATVIAMKKIGNIRLCVDPKPFNRAHK